MKDFKLRQSFGQCNPSVGQFNPSVTHLAYVHYCSCAVNANISAEVGNRDVFPFPFVTVVLPVE